MDLLRTGRKQMNNDYHEARNGRSELVVCGGV